MTSDDCRHETQDQEEQLTLAGLHDVLGDRLGDKLVDDVLEVGGRHLFRHDIDHLLPDVPDLAGLGVGGLLGAHILLLCEADAEQPGEGGENK